MRIPRDRVYEALDGERAYQDSLGTKTSGKPHVHSIEEYALYMEGYMDDLRRVLSHEWGPPAKERGLHIVRKIAALGVSCMEDNGVVYREGYAPPPPAEKS